MTHASITLSVRASYAPWAAPTPWPAYLTDPSKACWASSRLDEGSRREDRDEEGEKREKEREREEDRKANEHVMTGGKGGKRRDGTSQEERIYSMACSQRVGVGVLRDLGTLLLEVLSQPGSIPLGRSYKREAKTKHERLDGSTRLDGTRNKMAASG